MRMLIGEVMMMRKGMVGVVDWMVGGSVGFRSVSVRG